MIHPFMQRVHRKILRSAVDLLTFRKAKKLNEELYRAVRSIPMAEQALLDARLVELCKARGYSDAYIQDWMCHNMRVFLSIQELAAIIPLEREVNVLEMGGDSVITDILREKFPKAVIQNTVGDLRLRWESPDESADVIVSMEVLEHLTDIQGEGYLDGFYASGLKSTLRESWRVLRKGGKLFITTPNGASISSLAYLMSGKAAWVYPLHIREYTRAELSAELREAGFRIEKAEAVHCMTAPTGMDYTPLLQACLYYASEMAAWGNVPGPLPGGDDLFVVAVKD